MRSKIMVYWTTNPANLGYDGEPSDWQNQNGELMSLRKAYDFPWELSKRIGPGTYHAICYKHNGRIVSREEITDVLGEERKL